MERNLPTRMVGSAGRLPKGAGGGRPPTAIPSHTAPAQHRTPVHSPSEARGDVHSTELAIDTGGRHVTDLTDRIATFVRKTGDREGLGNVWVPHATAGGVARDERSPSDS